MTARPVLVFDGDGELVASFADAGAAHVFAHHRAVEAGARLPVQVEDRPHHTTRSIGRDGCRLITWQVADAVRDCAFPEPKP